MNPNEFMHNILTQLSNFSPKTADRRNRTGDYFGVPRDKGMMFQGDVPVGSGNGMYPLYGNPVTTSMFDPAQAGIPQTVSAPAQNDNFSGVFASGSKPQAYSNSGMDLNKFFDLDTEASFHKTLQDNMQTYNPDGTPTIDYTTQSLMGGYNPNAAVGVNSVPVTANTSSNFLSGKPAAAGMTTLDDLISLGDAPDTTGNWYDNIQGKDWFNMFQGAAGLGLGIYQNNKSNQFMEDKIGIAQDELALKQKEANLTNQRRGY